MEEMKSGQKTDFAVHSVPLSMASTNIAVDSRQAGQIKLNGFADFLSSAEKSVQLNLPNINPPTSTILLNLPVINPPEKSEQLNLPVMNPPEIQSVFLASAQQKESDKAAIIADFSSGDPQILRIKNPGDDFDRNPGTFESSTSTIGASKDRVMSNKHMTGCDTQDELSSSAIYVEHVCTILKDALQLGRFGDVTISVSGSKRKILCHRAILAASSPLLREVLRREEDDIQLCDVTFEEAMTLLNVIYTGRVALTKEKMSHIAHLATDLLGLSANFTLDEMKQANKVNKKRKRKKKEAAKMPYPRACRPLLSKSTQAAPVIVLIPDPPKPVPKPVLFQPPNLLNTAEEVPEKVPLTRYMQSKLSNPTKYKCDQCHRAFPTQFTLSRHMKSHTKEGSVYCKFCSKRFARASNLNNHIYNKHLEEKLDTIQRKKEEILRSSQYKKNVPNDRMSDVQVLNLEDLSQQISFQLPGYVSESGLEGSADNLMDMWTATNASSH